MKPYEQLFFILEVFKRKQKEEQQGLAWNMFYTLFHIFPKADCKMMVDDLCALSQTTSISPLPENAKIRLLAFCMYLSTVLDLLHDEVEEWRKGKNYPSLYKDV
jgi:hypothetical protein